MRSPSVPTSSGSEARERLRADRSTRRLCEHVFVRWESQQVDRDRERRLPRLGDDAVVRTFDAPEALDIRFHEVRAKSALNAVPKKSRMPFRWTVNPYRGCSHACQLLPVW